MKRSERERVPCFSEAIEKFLINSPVFSSAGNRHRLCFSPFREPALPLCGIWVLWITLSKPRVEMNFDGNKFSCVLLPMTVLPQDRATAGKGLSKMCTRDRRSSRCDFVVGSSRQLLWGCTYRPAVTTMGMKCKVQTRLARRWLTRNPSGCPTNRGRAMSRD